MCLLLRNYPWAKKTWVKMYTGAFVKTVGWNKLETEHLSKMAVGPGAGQLWSAQETSTDVSVDVWVGGIVWVGGAQVFIFSTLWANQIYQRTLSCQWANCALMEKRVMNIYREEEVLKVSFRRLYICCMERPSLYYPLPLLMNNVILDY